MGPVGQMQISKVVINVNRSRYVEMVCPMPGNEPAGQTIMVLHVYNKFTTIN